MQWVISDAATIHNKYRCSDQMVEIDYHRRNHDAPGPLPVVPEKQASNHKRPYQMKGIVNNDAIQNFQKNSKAPERIQKLTVFYLKSPK